MEIPPDAPASEEKGGRSYWGVVVWPAVVAATYVLSAGPAAWAADKRLITEKVLAVYLPVACVGVYTPLGEPLMKYIRLWSPDSFSDEEETTPNL